MKKQHLTLVALAVAGLIGIGVVTGNGDTELATTNGTTAPTEAATLEPVIEVSNEGKVVGYDGEEGVSALDTMRKTILVESDSSEFGEFVTRIGEVTADGDANEYWAFYVNGEPASVGADSYLATDGDMIEWKLESF